MTTKEAVHRLIDQLPEDELAIVEAFLEFLASRRLGDPLLAFLQAAPEDDEPTTPEEDASAEDAWREYQRGDVLPSGVVKRKLLE